MHVRVAAIALTMMVEATVLAHAPPPIAALPPVVLITPGRSGSSFLASWLAEALKATTLYFLEPCSISFHRHPGYATSDLTGTECAVLLGEIMSCNFTRVKLDQQVSTQTMDAFNFPWGNTTSAADCGADGRQLFIKETRLGTPVLQRMLTSEGWSHGSMVPRVVAIDRDPRAILASRKASWASWAHAIGSSINRRLAPEISSALEAWVKEASEEVESTPFDPSLQRGHPYSQSPHSLCTEMLLTRQLVKARSALSATSPAGVPVLLVAYDDVLQRPHATANEVLRFVGKGDDKSKRVVSEFVTQYTTGACMAKDLAFSTCRNQTAAARDNKWARELLPWERYVIETEPACRELLVAQGRSDFIADTTSELTAVALLSEARSGVAALHDAAKLIGSKIQVTFELSTRGHLKRDSSVCEAVYLYWVTRYARSTGHSEGPLSGGQIKSRHLLQRVAFQDAAGTIWPLNTLHDHEFVVLKGGCSGLNEDFSSNNGSDVQELMNWVANAALGKVQRVHVSLETPKAAGTSVQFSSELHGSDL